MKTKLNLYLAIGLLLSGIPSLSYATNIQWHVYGIEVESYGKLDVQACNDILHAVIVDIFFDINDTTSFSMIATMLAEVLTMKRDLLPYSEYNKHNDIINFLNENKHRKDFKTWATFLPAPELRLVLSQETNDFINNTPLFKLVKTLNKKLSI